MGRKPIFIEDLLAWAYRQELPKVHRGAGAGLVASGAALSGWGAIERYGELLTLVDVSPNGFGCIPDFWMGDEAEPHSDALAVASAMADLCEASIRVGGEDVLSDITVMTEAERADLNALGRDAAKTSGVRLAALVTRRAMLGGAPNWRGHGETERRTVLTAKGRPAWFRVVMRQDGEGRPELPVMVDGFDAVHRRPYPGAFQRTYLDPCPSLLAIDRLEYQAWVAALDFLAGRLGEIGLTAHSVVAGTRPAWPWEGEATRAVSVRVLPVPLVAAEPPRKSKRAS